jgi:predicted nucleic acid-binding protein
MTPNTVVVLDACVLIPMPLADTLLRLAEEPRLYRPKWSDSLLAEVSRNLEGPPWNLSPKATQRRGAQMKVAFPDASVTGYESLISTMKNHPKDRHVLAAAVRAEATVIVTYDRAGFSERALKPFGIAAIGPSLFLKALYSANRDVVIDKLVQQSADIGLTIEELIGRLAVNVPAFAEALSLDR